MVICKRVLTLSALATAAVLSACATSENAVITRSWQIDHVLAEKRDTCRYAAISSTLSDEIKGQSDGAYILKNLEALCPELTVRFTENADEGTVASLNTKTAPQPEASPETPSDNDSTDGASSDASSSNDDSDASDSSNASDSGTTSDSGNASDSDNSSDGSDTSGDGATTTNDGASDGGKSKGRGSRANNGGGNGSEGHSPGRGSGANVDE